MFRKEIVDIITGEVILKIFKKIYLLATPGVSRYINKIVFVIKKWKWDDVNECDFAIFADLYFFYILSDANNKLDIYFDILIDHIIA